MREQLEQAFRLAEQQGKPVGFARAARPRKPDVCQAPAEYVHPMNRQDLGLDDPRAPAEFACIECGGSPHLVKGDRIYPHRPDLHEKNFYLCECSAYCGTHPNTSTPLGYPCGAETRKARNGAHQAIDTIWRDKLMSRKAVYAELSRRLGISHDKTHVAMMTAEQARNATLVALDLRREVEARSRR